MCFLLIFCTCSCSARNSQTAVGLNESFDRTGISSGVQQGFTQARSPEGKVVPLFPPQREGNVIPLPIKEPEIKKVISEGVATIFNGNVAQARLTAMRAAYAEAVERVSGLDIRSLTVIKDVKNVSDIVMSRSKGYIKNYRILSEGIPEKEPGKYRVLIEAEVVNKGTVKDDDIEGLRLYLGLLDNPKLLIMLPEKQFGLTEAELDQVSQKKTSIQIESEGTIISVHKSENVQSQKPVTAEGNTSDVGTTFRSVEAALAQAFARYGYQVITSDDLLARGVHDPDVLAQAKAGVTAQAMKVARAEGADIALFGVMQISKEMRKTQGVELVLVSAQASAKALLVSYQEPQRRLMKNNSRN